MLKTALVVAMVVIAVVDGGAAPPRSQTVRELTTSSVSRSPEVTVVRDAMPGSFVMPVPTSSDISSPYGPRWKWSSTRYDMHRGIDYYDALNTPIMAIANGKVTQITFSSSGGNTVVIEHALTTTTSLFHNRSMDKVYSYYLHLNSYTVAVDDVVTKGQVIGAMGQTGSTTFTHLHFETRLVGYCSMEFQVANNRVPSPTSSCNTGFDPHVHPYLFVGGDNSGPKSLWEISPASGYAFAVRYNATRGHLDLDVIESSLGKVGINTREGINARTIESLDALDTITTYMSLRPNAFQSTTESVISYEIHFTSVPTFVEVRDIHGNGIRWDSSLTPNGNGGGSSGNANAVSLVASALLLVLMTLFLL